MESLVGRFGSPIAKALLDLNGDVDMEIRVVLNHETYVTEDRKKAVLWDGDMVAFRGAS